MKSTIKIIFKMHIVLFVVFLNCKLLAENNIMTTSQVDIMKANKVLLDKYALGEPISQNDLKKVIDPLFNEIFKKYRMDLWGNRGLKDLLAPNIGRIKQKNVPSPYFSYVLFKFFNSQRYKNSKIAFKQKSCSYLASYLRSKYYKAHHKIIFRLLLLNFHEPHYYTQATVENIKKTITNDSQRINLPRFLLLLTVVDDKPLTYGLKLSLSRMADKCKYFNRKSLIPWLALILLARDGDEKYLNKLINIVKTIDNTPKGIRKATYMFPYLTMVQKSEMVELMKTFLEDKKITDQGEDIMHRYSGLSYLSAQVLYTMLDGYVNFSPYKFDQAERKKCLDWFKKNETYNFRKIDYWTSDRIIARMRYLIFYVR